jgi:hypothetical protein
MNNLQTDVVQARRNQPQFLETREQIKLNQWILVAGYKMMGSDGQSHRTDL